MLEHCSSFFFSHLSCFYYRVFRRLCSVFLVFMLMTLMSKFQKKTWFKNSFTLKQWFLYNSNYILCITCQRSVHKFSQFQDWCTSYEWAKTHATPNIMFRKEEGRRDKNIGRVGTPWAKADIKVLRWEYTADMGDIYLSADWYMYWNMQIQAFF